MRPPPTLLLPLLCACDAGFTDLRTATPQPSFADVGVIDAGFDDAGMPVMLPTVVVRRGSFEGRAGHNGSGEVELLRIGGALELRFADSFSSSGVPGPVVVLSPRDRLGTRLDPAAGDVELGTLQRSRGPQTYPAPPGAEQAAYVWIFCKPFGVEVARAALSEVP